MQPQRELGLGDLTVCQYSKSVPKGKTEPCIHKYTEADSANPFPAQYQEATEIAWDVSGGGQSLPLMSHPCQQLQWV